MARFRIFWGARPASSGGSTHTLTGANADLAGSSTAGAITQAHQLASSNAAQATSSSTAAITQTHTLAAANATQDGTASAGAIGQTHALAGSNSAQAGTSSSGSISVGGSVVLAAADCAQAGTSSTGAIAQTHNLAGSGAAQAASSAAGSIVQVHVLASAGAIQGGTTSAGVISAPGAVVLVAATAMQGGSSSGGGITQTHRLVGANAVHGGTSSTVSLAPLARYAGMRSLRSLPVRRRLWGQTINRRLVSSVQARRATIMGTTGRVSALDIEEGAVLEFDYTAELPTGVTISSAAITVDVRTGTDPTPAALLNGAAQVQTGGKVVLQAVEGAGVSAEYAVRCVAACSDSLPRVMSMLMPVRRL